MSQRKTLITLVSLKQAVKGFTFLHMASAPKCEGCKYIDVCVRNLEPGRVYRVTGVRGKTVECGLAEAEMKVVEVVECETETAIPSKQAIEGAIILFQTPECTADDCVNLEICFPKGLLKDDRCKIAKINGNFHCRQGVPLVRVVLLRIPAS